MKCECEHKDHFDGGPEHPYGKVPAGTIRMTAYGSFALCDTCIAAGHQS